MSSEKKNGNMSSPRTADICDTYISPRASGDLRILQPVFQIYGQSQAFSGQVVTVKVFEDNVFIKELVESKGEGRVLVIDGRGSMRCALIGDKIVEIAQSMGWSGIVVNGCIRDVDGVNALQIGVRALGSHPLRPAKNGWGEKHVGVYVGGSFIRDGEWLYADNDGIIVSTSELSNCRSSGVYI